MKQYLIVFRRRLRLALPAVTVALLFLSCAGPKTEQSVHHRSAGSGDSTGGRIVSCCIKPSCDVCVQNFGKCTCLEDLKAGRPVCGECINGYKEGKGKLKLISIPEIKRREGT